MKSVSQPRTRRSQEEIARETRRRTEAEVAELIERIEDSPFAAAVFDDQRRFVAISDSALAMYHPGGKRQEVIGAKLDDFVDSEWRQQAIDDFERMTREGHTTSQMTQSFDGGEPIELTNVSLANVLPGLHLAMSLGFHRLGAHLPQVSVLIAAPKPLTADLLDSMINQDREEQVVGKCTDVQCSDMHNLNDMLLKQRPDVVVVAPLFQQLMYQTEETNTPQQMIASLKQVIDQHNLDSKILLISSQTRPDVIRQSIEAGASGVLGIADDGDTVRRAIAAVAQGESYVSPSMATSMFEFEDNGIEKLSPREREVLRLIALGYTNQECGQELYLSPRTVESHRASINRTMGFHSRKDLVAYALERQIIP